MPVENPGMSSILDLMPSTKVVRTEELREREAAQRASNTLAFGAANRAESMILNLLRKEGPQEGSAAIVRATGLDPSEVSKTLTQLSLRKLVRRKPGLLGDRDLIAVV